MDLHRGKCTEEAKTMVTPEFHDWIVEKAREQRCTPSELIRDGLYLAFTGDTYASHVAKDRRAAFQTEGHLQGDNKASQ